MQGCIPWTTLKEISATFCKEEFLQISNCYSQTMNSQGADQRHLLQLSGRSWPEAMSRYSDFLRWHGIAGDLRKCIHYSAGSANPATAKRWILNNLNPPNNKTIDDLRYVLVCSRNRQHMIDGAEGLVAFLSDVDRMPPGMIRDGLPGEQAEEFGESAEANWIYGSTVPPEVSWHQLVRS